MKTLFFALAGCLAVSPAAARADLLIVQKVEGVGQSMETTTRYKDGKTRLDVVPGGVSIIMDAKSGDLINLQLEQKTYLKTPVGVVKAAVDRMKAQQPASAGGQNAKPEPTGRKETIAGFPAEEYVYTVAGTKISLWLTHDIPDYEQAMKELAAAFSQGPLAATMQSLSLDMGHLPGFPVRIVNEVQPGTSVTSTVTSVSVKPLDDGDFKVPADFKEMTAPMLTPPAANAVPSPGH